MTISRPWTTTICAAADPTAHKAFDEATAILAGDGLLTYAFDVLADPATHADAQIRARLVLALARAAGLGGMVGGQALDLEAEKATQRRSRRRRSLRLQAMKTGALLRICVDFGAILGGASAAGGGRARPLWRRARRRLPDRRRYSRRRGRRGGARQARRQGRRAQQGDA